LEPGAAIGISTTVLFPGALSGRDGASFGPFGLRQWNPAARLGPLSVSRCPTFTASAVRGIIPSRTGHAIAGSASSPAG